MLRRNFYISRTVDYQVSSSELDFIEHLEDFNFMTLGHDDDHDQKVIDYYIDHFDYLVNYAFRLNSISDRRLYLKLRQFSSPITQQLESNFTKKHT